MRTSPASTGMDIDSLPEGARKAASHLRKNYDMADHARGAGAHAQALDADFIDRFGIVGPVDTAIERFSDLADTGIDFLRIVPGSRGHAAWPSAAPSLQALATEVLPSLRQTLVARELAQ